MAKKKVRTFVRGLDSATYGLNDFRQAQLANPRVRDNTIVTDDGTVGHSANTKTSHTAWRIGPGDDLFLTQTINVHFTGVDGHGQNGGHGHQNEAAFYILEGAGYEIHDGIRYDWKKDDLVYVHTDSVHQHFNPYDENALALVVKAKSTWMFMGLIQQGKSGPIDRPDEFGPREEWGRIWTPGVLDRKKVISVEDTTWEMTPLGNQRIIAAPEKTEGRIHSTDSYELKIEPGSRSGKYWKMADEVFYALDGGGHVLMWEVEAEIAEKYYARMALEPKRFDFTKGDTIYVPQNHVVQIFANDGTPARLFQSQNRLFRTLGYDNIHFFEDAPEYTSAGELITSPA